jgi:hypothetical protein
MWLCDFVHRTSDGNRMNQNHPDFLDKIMSFSHRQMHPEYSEILNRSVIQVHERMHENTFPDEISCQLNLASDT